LLAVASLNQSTLGSSEITAQEVDSDDFEMKTDSNASLVDHSSMDVNTSFVSADPFEAVEEANQTQEMSSGTRHLEISSLAEQWAQSSMLAEGSDDTVRRLAAAMRPATAVSRPSNSSRNVNLSKRSTSKQGSLTRALSAHPGTSQRSFARFRGTLEVDGAPPVHALPRSISASNSSAILRSTDLDDKKVPLGSQRTPYRSPSPMQLRKLPSSAHCRVETKGAVEKAFVQNHRTPRSLRLKKRELDGRTRVLVAHSFGASMVGAATNKNTRALVIRARRTDARPMTAALPKANNMRSGRKTRPTTAAFRL
jgi:hypothetical protein